MKSLLSILAIFTTILTLTGQTVAPLSEGEKEVNYFLKYSTEFENTDSTIVYLESKWKVNLNCLAGIILIYGMQKNLLLNKHEIKTIEKRALDLTTEFYNRGTPIQLLKEKGGAHGKGEMRVRKTKTEAYVRYDIIMSETDVKFQMDTLTDELFLKINIRTAELLEGNVNPGTSK